jgi:hypothetical protein
MLFIQTQGPVLIFKYFPRLDLLFSNSRTSQDFQGPWINWLNGFGTNVPCTKRVRLKDLDKNVRKLINIVREICVLAINNNQLP